MPTVVLPEPDSPTTPSVRPGYRLKLASFTASIVLCSNKPVFSRYSLRKSLRFDQRRPFLRTRLTRLQHNLRRVLVAHEVIDDRQSLRFDVEPWPAQQQRLRVRILRRAENLIDRARFAHRAFAHHHHVVGDLAHQSEIVADEQHAHPVARLQSRDQLENLPLHGDVERSGRLIGDQQASARTRLPSQSSRAAADRPTTRADTHRRAPSAPECRLR